MIERIKEIRSCLENKCYHAALSLALTLPDICGDIKYPNTYSSYHYVKWFDEYVYPYYYKHDNACDEFRKLYEFNGSVCYQLRCRFLHNNDLNIHKPEKDSYIKNFTLSVCTVPGQAIDEINIEYICEPIKRKKEGRFGDSSLKIDVIRLCNAICNSVEHFYDELADDSAFESCEIIIVETEPI